jgi:hypothetical protein
VHFWLFLAVFGCFWLKLASGEIGQNALEKKKKKKNLEKKKKKKKIN